MMPDPSAWRTFFLGLGFVALVAADGCGVAKPTLTARCGFVVSSPDTTRVCAYDPSSCKPITKTDVCASSEGQSYSNFTAYSWVCSYDSSKCQSTTPSSYSDTFNKVYSDNQEAFKSSVFFSNAKPIQESGLFCYDDSKKELGVVAIASSRHCIYDSSCNVAPFTSATKSVAILSDYFTVNSSVALSGLGIESLGTDLASDFDKSNRYSDLELIGNRISDISATKFPGSLYTLDVSSNNLTSITKIQAANLNTLSASNNAITSIDALPMMLWSLVMEYNLVSTLNASSLPTGMLVLNVGSNRITSISGSFPSGLTILIVARNELTSFPVASLSATVEQLDLSGNQLATVADLSKLAKLQTLKIQGNVLTALPPLPDKVAAVLADQNRLSAFPTALPASLQTLNLAHNNMGWTSSSPFPSNISNLNLSGNPLTGGQLNASLLPTSLQSLDVSGCGITVVVGDFPPRLTTVRLGNNSIENFPLSAATLTLFNSIPNGLVLPAKVGALTCSASTQVTIKTANQSVVFCPDTTSVSAASDGLPSTGKGWFFGIGAGIVLVAIVAVVVLYRKRLVRSKALSKLLEDFNSHRSRQSKLDSMAGFEFTATPGIVDTTTGLSRFETSLAEGELAEHRIPLNDVKILGPLHGKHKNASVPGTMMLYKAEFDGRLVVLKTLMTDTNMHGRASNGLREQADAFLDVILLRARLDHPNIVGFIGAVWSSNLRKGMLGFGFLSEHMPRGDLGRLLTLDQSRSAGERLFKWMPRSSNAMPKLSLVSDIALAIVCLHSFAPAIMHRNLHARHVLLTDEFVAKLSGFRPQDEDGDAVRRFVPDKLLTPPEVLKGEAWTEKADIYAFGILICEVDLGHHPYAHTIKGGDAEDNSNQIATLVMADLLQPTFSVECPIDVQDVAKKCLAHNAEDRPSAVQMEYWLRKLRLSY
ncbi:protein kinase [Achlya hypogyna]|uniref:non-specific serine/threonine protein kinase n=1 Tax=Achlya hypogyna TaxID=1202772 RepID=A0A1V9ZE18_ACHHY|nr:protein kinase [Achlya hypogyna]